MSSVAVQLVGTDGDVVSGILIAEPKVGEDCRLDIGASIFRIKRVRGWIGLCGSNQMTIWDGQGNRFHMSLLASSKDFF
jgi:hypothetical protein